MSEIIPSELSSLIETVLYLAVIGVVLSIIYGIAELFSRDRAIKIFEGKYAFVFFGNEAFYGRIRVPPRSGGGFEVLFPPEGIENPVSLLAFLVENYNETKDRKFLEEAKELLEDFKKRGIVPKDFKLEDVKNNPWTPPSLVSRKVFSQELGKLSALLIFKHTLDEEELRERWRELRRLYHPGFFSRAKRKVYNSLAYVKDKISAAVTRTTGAFMATLAPEIRTGVETLEKKVISGVGAIYDALLENSVGRLITVQVQDIDGEVKLYQGVLREYSNNYIVVYDVDYRIKMLAKFRGTELEEGFPKPQMTLHGWRFKEGEHIIVKDLKFENNVASFKLVNTSMEPMRVVKVNVDGNEVAVSKVLFPNDEIEISASANSDKPVIEVLYEISREADIIWPKSKVKVIGLGDYPPTILKSILSVSKMFRLK